LLYIRQFAFLVAALAASPAFAVVSVVISPAAASLPANGSRQFSAKVFGAANQTVRWEVNGVPGGAPSIGVISDAGLYTAPPDAPQALIVTVEAEPAAAPASPGAAKVAVARGFIGKKLGASYYVTTTGSNSNPGTEAMPWLTIQHAVDTAPAGSEIFVQSGVYNELVTITRSGTASAGFLTLEAAPSASPIIDGTGLGVPNGQNGLVTISNASWVRVKGFELRNYVSQSAEFVPVGIYVEGAGNHIEILNNHVHAITTTVTTSSGDALGIAVYGSDAPASINWLTVDGNTLDNLTTGFSESLSLSGNVERWQVTNNIIHDNDNIGVNIEGFYQTAPKPAYDQARRGLVAGNVVYNITSIDNPAYGGSRGADGLYVSGGTLVTLQDNLVYQTDIGIEMASEIAGKATSFVWAHDNIVHHSFVAGISVGGADDKANGGANHCFIANNTLYLNDTTQSGSGEFQAQYHASANQFVNNIVSANDQGLFVNAFDPAGPPGIVDHNLYFSTGDTSGDPWIWRNNDYASLGVFRSAVGQDKHSKVANPDFVSAAAGNFSIPSTSPAVALGEIVSLSSNGLDDYAGHPRRLAGTIDAGALQH
jgi:hypothetical protein